MRPVAVPENALQRELGVTYKRISVDAAVKMVEDAKRVDWPTSFKNSPEDFTSALQKLTNNQVGSISTVPICVQLAARDHPTARKQQSGYGEQHEATNPHAKFSNAEEVILTETQVRSATGYLQALANNVENDNALTQQRLREAAAAYNADIAQSNKLLMSSLGGGGAARADRYAESLILNRQLQLVEGKALLIKMNAPAESKVVQVIKPEVQQLYGPFFYPEFAIVESPDTAPFVVAKRQINWSKNNVTNVTHFTYEKTDPLEALRIIDAEKGLYSNANVPDFVRTLHALAKESTVPTTPVTPVMQQAGDAEAKNGEPLPANPHARLTEIEAASMRDYFVQLAKKYLQALADAKANDNSLTQQQLQLATDDYNTYNKRVNALLPTDKGEAQVINWKSDKEFTYGVNEKTVADKALLIMVEAPEEAKVMQTIQLELQQANGSYTYPELTIVEQPNAPSFVVVTQPVITPENPIQQVLGVSHERISIQEASRMVNTAKEVHWPSFGKNSPDDFIMALQKLSNDQISSISPMMKPQTYDDAVAHLENPEARALVNSYVDAKKYQIMAAGQEHQA